MIHSTPSGVLPVPALETSRCWVIERHVPEPGDPENIVMDMWLVTIEMVDGVERGRWTTNPAIAWRFTEEEARLAYSRLPKWMQATREATIMRAR